MAIPYKMDEFSLADGIFSLSNELGGPNRGNDEQESAKLEGISSSLAHYSNGSGNYGGITTYSAGYTDSSLADGYYDGSLVVGPTYMRKPEETADGSMNLKPMTPKNNVSEDGNFENNKSKIPYKMDAFSLADGFFSLFNELGGPNRGNDEQESAMVGINTSLTHYSNGLENCKPKPCSALYNDSSLADGYYGGSLPVGPTYMRKPEETVDGSMNLKRITPKNSLTEDGNPGNNKSKGCGCFPWSIK